MPYNQQNNQSDDLPIVDIPHKLSLKDLVVIVSVAITLAVQWGLFSTRLALLEKSQAQLEQEVRTQSADIRHLQVITQDNTQFIDELFRIQNKPVPQHSDMY